MRSASLNGGLEAEPPARSRGRAPGQAVSGQMNPYFYYRALIRDSYLRKRANESLLLLQSSDTRFLSEKTKIANKTPINLRVRWKKNYKNINRPNVITVNFK